MLRLENGRKKKAAVKNMGVKKELSVIRGMIGKPAIDVNKMLAETVVSMPMIHVIQISPFVRKEIQRLSQAGRRRHLRRQQLRPKKTALKQWYK